MAAANQSLVTDLDEPEALSRHFAAVHEAWSYKLRLSFELTGHETHRKF